MKRGTSLVWVGLMVAVAVGTYAMKDRASRAADHVMKLRADIARQKEAVAVLRAEWSVLDQPARLQSLVGRYEAFLQLQPLDVHQLASIRDVPDKPPAGSEATLDSLRTGSIAKPSATAIPRTAAQTAKPHGQPLPIRSPRHAPSAAAALGE